MSDWRPIESAPKDGQYILLGNERGVWVGAYVERFQSGYRPQIPWLSQMLNHRHMKKGSAVAPTHWMPLPELPEDA